MPPLPSHHRSMSCLNLHKLLPARKAWKIFSNKVQSKLHRLNKSKTMKKKSYPKKNQVNKKISWPGFSIPQPCFHKRKKLKLIKSSQTLSNHTNKYFKAQRPSSPVYIDHLFIEPAVVSVVVKEHLQPTAKADYTKGSNNEEAATACTSSSSNKAELPHNVDVEAKTMTKTSCNEEMNSADEMWESLVLGSPQMNGINERAEEFITRFRAEMLLQERLPAPDHHV